MKPLDPALVPHLRPARRALLTQVVAGTAQGLLAVAQAFAVGTLIVRLVTDPSGNGWHTPALWLGMVVVVRGIASYVSDIASARAAALVSGHLRRRLLEAAARLDPLDLSRRRTGELTTLATRGMAAVEPYMTKYLPALVLAAVLPVATIATIWWLDWTSGLIVVLTLPLVPVFAILIGLNTQDRADRQWREMGTLAGHFLDVVRGLPTLVTHRRAGAQSRTIRQVTDRYRTATLDTLKVAFASSAALEFIATLSVALVAVIVGLRLAADGIDFRTALVVLLLAPEAYWPWRRVGAEFHSAAEGTATFEAASALLAQAPEADVSTPTGPTPRVSVRAVGFTYPGRTTPALVPTDAALPDRGVVAITGPSGAGKSTLLALLAGELTPTVGTVMLDDEPLTATNVAAWRHHVATAPQRPWLTAASVADNLRVGAPEAADTDLWAALATVDLTEAITALPRGLDTPLGEDGAGLSAGQRARLALARVVLANRPVVLLDEPSAHLDAVSEQVLVDTLGVLAERSLVIVVAHRDAVVDAADVVVTVTQPGAAAPAHARDTADEEFRTPAAVVVNTAGAPGNEVRPSRWGVRTGALLGAASVASGVALTATAAWLITRASEHPPVMYLVVATVGVRLFGIARPGLRYLERLVSHDAAFRVLAERRAAVYDALVPLVPGRLGRRRGDLLTSVVDDVDALVDRELRVRQPRSTAVIVSVLITLAAAVVHPLGGLLTAAVCFLAALPHALTVHGVRAAEGDFVQARATLSTRVEEYLHGLRQWVAWQADGPVLNRVDDASGRLARASVRSAAATARGHLVVTLVTGAGLLAMAYVIAGPLRDGGISPAMAALLVMVPLALVDAFGPLVDAAPVAVRTEAANRRLDALTSLAPAVDVVDGSHTAVAHHPAVALEHVTAGWGAQAAFTGLDLDLPAGERIGLVGPSGCGKSTVAALLLRFLDPTAGRVVFDGHDGRTVHPDAVREQVGLVDDDPYVFASTVAENVRLARPDADDADVRTALERAHLGPWLAELPHGLDTMVGEGWAHVSGGERARLALARALLAGQPVLVLDEPTAHLDAETARKVTDELLDSGGRSVLWITHGKVGLERMDHVVTMGPSTATDSVAPACVIRTEPSGTPSV